MYSKQPDLVVLLGVRSFLSLLAILFIAIGDWMQEDLTEEEAMEEAARAEALGQKQSGLLSGVVCHAPLGCVVVEDDDDEAVWHLTCGDVLPKAGANKSDPDPDHPDDEVKPASSKSLDTTKRTSLAASSTAEKETAKVDDAPLTWNNILTAIQTRVIPPALALHSKQVDPPTTSSVVSGKDTAVSDVTSPPPLVNVSWIQVDAKRFWPGLVFVGWMLLGLSCLLTRKGWWGLDVNFFAFLGIVNCIFMSITQWVQHHKLLDRQHLPQHTCLTAFGIVILGILLAVNSPAANALSWAPPLGALMTGASLIVSWYSRRAGGELYAKSGKLNARPVVFHFGGVLWAWGWFWTWMGMNAVAALPDSWYVPVYLGSRAAVAYTGALVIIGVMFATCYALDEHNGVDASNPNAGPGFGALGYFIGAVWEIKIAVTLAWLYMGSAEFLPTLENADNVLGPYLTFVAFCLHGVVLSIFYEIAIRSFALDIVRRWALNSGGVLLLLALFLCFHGMFTAVLAIISALCIFGGQMKLHEDRKRGHHWIATNGSQVNPRPRVFTTGSPTFALGMALLAWAVSLR